MEHIQRVDLNLLVPLAALLEERHISRASERVRLTQPAMSRALRRLRDTFDDELLVRTRSGYRLTARAARIQQELLTILPRLDALFAGEAFDPATATNELRLAGTDYATSVLAPALVQRMSHEAPSMVMDFGTWHDDVFDDVERGRLDVVFSGVPVPEPLRSEHLFADHFVCVLARDHPATADRLTLAEFARYSHVIVDVRGGRQTAIEDRLRELDVRRPACVRVRYHTAAAPAVPGTTLIATLPWRIAAAHAGDPALRIVAAPVELEPMHYLMAWHPRADGDPAHRWLRDVIRSVAAILAQDSSGSTTAPCGARQSPRHGAGRE
ncbi:MAG TPA: LysR family transcriptional regulator [Pseudonocardia sp.]